MTDLEEFFGSKWWARIPFIILFIATCIVLYSFTLPISTEKLQLIHNNRKLFITQLELDPKKLSCYKEPQHKSEQCQTLTNKSFPIKFYCDDSHCEFMK